MARSTSIAPYPAPHDRTARRLEWAFLPPHLRAWIERRCGSPVVSATSQTSGFTPGFASVLVCEDGSRHFVKAASTKAQRMFADSYREEARKLAALPEGVPAPRLLWHLDDDWVVLGIEYVAARPPRRPWQAEDLDALLDSLEVVADVLTPPPPGLDLDTAADDFAPLVEGWPALRERRTDLDAERLAEAEALARRYAEVVGGDTLVHTDIRSDNVLLDPEGRALVCDWNWPVRGAAWFDSLRRPHRAARRGHRRRRRHRRAPLAARRRPGGVRHQPRPLRGLLLHPVRAARAADVAAPPRPPALAGRGVLGLAGGAAALGVTGPRAVGVRLPYGAVPAVVRAWVEDELGSPVVAAAEQVGGMSPGCATRLTCADGTRAFVKAVGPSSTPTPPDCSAARSACSTTSASTSSGPGCWRRTTTGPGSRCSSRTSRAATPTSPTPQSSRPC